MEIENVINYDSRADTYEHIQRVQHYIHDCAIILIERGEEHDRSKLSGIEKETFDRITPLLRNTEYGSDQYRATLRESYDGIQAHYKANPHHPEYYENGINEMSLIDLLEMFCDWKAAGERHSNGGNILKSIEINKERHGIDDQLASILVNTAKELGWA